MFTLDAAVSTLTHYNDVIMGAIASQITGLTIIYSTVYSGADERKHQSSASLAFVWGIHRWPVKSPHKKPVTWKTFPLDDVIMSTWRMDHHEALILMESRYIRSVSLFCENVSVESKVIEILSRNLVRIDFI